MTNKKILSLRVKKILSLRVKQSLPLHAERASGYTIIEILVALSIAGIIFGAGFVSFRDFSRRQVLAGSVRAVKGDLRLTQEYSLIGKKPQDARCMGTNILDSYAFFVSAANQYVIRAYCSGSSGGIVDVKTVDLPSDIEILSSLNPVVFKALGAGTNLLGDTAVTLSQVSTQVSGVITITPGGEIK